MDKLLKKIVDNIEYNAADSIIFETHDKKSVEIKKDNFHDIIEKNTEKTIAFIDGGNLEIIKSPSLSLFFNRIYYTIYKSNKRIKNKVIEFYTLITAVNKEDMIFYKTEYLFTKNNLEIKEYLFDSFDKSLTTGNRRAPISLIGNIIRRFAELILAKEIPADFVVIDGSLKPKYVYEKEIIETLKNKSMYGLSKTTNLLTKNGNSVGAYLINSTEQKTWYYKVDTLLFFLKLHPKTNYVFKFETFNENNFGEVLTLLKKNSKDAIFLGYPYGLIEADKFARVSLKEQEMLRLQLQMKLKKDYEKILPLLNSLNAHDILDNIS